MGFGKVCSACRSISIEGFSARLVAHLIGGWILHGFVLRINTNAKFISLCLDEFMSKDLASEMFVQKVSESSVRFCIHVERNNGNSSGNATAGQFIAHLKSRAHRTARSRPTITHGSALEQERWTHVASSIRMCRRTHFDFQNGPNLHTVDSKRAGNEAWRTFAYSLRELCHEAPPADVRSEA